MADEASEPQRLMPFRVINRGEDTVDEDGNVLFADFSPRAIPSDVPDEIVEVAVPKEESVPEPVPSSESPETGEPKMSGTNVPAPVDKDAGKPSPTENEKRTSSSDKKTG